MPDELPPNQVCRKCGAENLATAERCLECNAPLAGRRPAAEPILRIVDKDVRRPRRGGVFSRGFLRIMSVPGVALGVAIAWPSPETKGIAALFGFILTAYLAMIVTTKLDPTDFRRPRPHEVWEVIDVLLCGVGCLFAVVAGLAVSIFGLFFAYCSCAVR